MHVTVCQVINNYYFKKIKLKSFFQLGGVITVSISVLNNILKIVDIVGGKSFYTSFLIITILTCIYIHSFVDIHESLVGLAHKNLTEKYPV